ncbi:MAG TPA: AcvB/VirJ family lysyl-phosphatidylglycerol hydrolase [Longimicrobiales bacterium]
MTFNHLMLAGLVALTLGARPSGDDPRYLTVYLRGRKLDVRVYDPKPGTPRRNLDVLVASGDLGWLQLSGDVPRHLVARGYRVVGLNVMAYLNAFTGSDAPRLTDRDVAHDFKAIMEAASVDSSTPPPFVAIGVSEGASLAVMAAGQAEASRLCRGVIGLGLPMYSEMAWRWTDFPSWITKAEPHEPLAATRKYLEQLDVPLVVVHSIHDEYDPIDSVRAAVAHAPVPKRFYAINAPNHRFTHHTGEVLRIVDNSLAWMDSLRVAPAQASAALRNGAGD